MKQPKKFSKSAQLYIYKSPSTPSQPQSPQMIGPTTGIEPEKKHPHLFPVDILATTHYKTGLQSQYVTFLQAL